MTRRKGNKADIKETLSVTFEQLERNIQWYAKIFRSEQLAMVRLFKNLKKNADKTTCTTPKIKELQ